MAQPASAATANVVDTSHGRHRREGVDARMALILGFVPIDKVAAVPSSFSKVQLGANGLVAIARSWRSPP